MVSWTLASLSQTSSSPPYAMLSSVVISLLATGSVALYYQPGIPPQCFDEYQCIFHRFPTETGLKDEYSWDLRSLCRGAGQEYTATSGSTPPSNNIIKFNICGVVGTPIAPAKTDTPGPQEIPIPHAYGTAIQFIVDPNNPNPSPPPGPDPNNPGLCANLDTCDYLYNPGYLANQVCAVGSLNYQQGVSPSYPVREARCDPNAGGNPAYCSPYNYWCCSVKSTPCTDNAEVLAYYDGSAPNFNLVNEGDVNRGITLSYAPALNYEADPFGCGGQDPSTGYAYTRSLKIVLNCDASVKNGLSNIVYTEDATQVCSYTITASTAAACPKKGDPFDCPGKLYGGGDAFGFVVLGAVLVGFVYVVYTFGEQRLWWETPKAYIARYMPPMPSWMPGSRGGVFNNPNAYKFVGSSSSSGATAPATATPISASAYGST